MMIRLLCALLLALLANVACAAEPAVVTIEQAQTVRSSGWDATQPPAAGWVPVKLMDEWNSRWPGYSGVVWYRIRWNQMDGSAPVGLLLDYTCMAAEVRLNGSVIDRDYSLVEPLSRKWHVPRYYLVQAPLLRQGQNELLVRVSGMSAYQPGFGTVSVGDPATLQASFNEAVFIRRDLQILDFAIGIVMASLFGLFWLLRRQDTTYGWYAISGLFGGLYGSNYIADSTWPFPTTNMWQSFIAACFVAMVVAHAIFLLRYCDRRWPRIERALLLIATLALVLVPIIPDWMGPQRNTYLLPAIVFVYAANLAFIAYALRHRRSDYLVLAACVSVPLVMSFHDLAVYLCWMKASTYLGALLSPLTVLGMGFVLAYRFANTMKRVEGFNAELTHEVHAATSQLGETLNQQHALELAHSRAGERLQLVRDLHDGFGGTLVGTIAELKQAPEDMAKSRIVDILSEMRDDLRLVIDSTAREHADLAELIVPLRHRASRLLEAADIEDHWSIQGLEGVDIGSVRSLDLLRLLQEALTNVFKHSRARRVDVTLEISGSNLRLQVRDDGVGMASADPEPRASREGGAGMASMRLRAQRLKATFDVNRREDGTVVNLLMPLMA
ncbi:Histidine kinase-, DNA gyrase B-, and HSP90-like ATPase [Lysobacter silvestris]|uniref:Histidine kinase-, DNA gyrase B-, and HSP90-like ATPase n=2 Tax=Solilutibacter silvestris TaxID=1645665 RepID=A0A2K1Q0W0_9GAMM|nr:Histidine kinase-, DNA gyrase B-, and HSP90-like ATPase [Lysobacter silvestris]